MNKQLMILAVSGMLTALSVSSAHGSDLTYTIQRYSPEYEYVGVHLYDMDGDGHDDILAGNYTAKRVEIWTYDPTSVSFAKTDEFSVSHNIHDVAAADFDNDGDKDVVVGLRFNGLYYATNNGPGNWSLRVLDSTYSWKILIGDFDNDGHLDIYDGVDGGADNIRLFYGDGSGNFVNPWRYFPPTNLPRGFNILDIDGDGVSDLIGTGGEYMRAFLNPGNRTEDWASIGPPDPVASMPGTELITNLTPSAADLDGNGVVDQVGFLQHFDSGLMLVVVFEGAESAGVYTWTPRLLDVLSGPGPYGTAGIADLDDDGNLDIHVAGGSSFPGVAVYLGDGVGNYTREWIALDHGISELNGFVASDINGDGATDIVASRAPSDGFEVLYRGGLDPTLSVDPGQAGNINTWTTTNGSPDRRMVVYYGLDAGETPVPFPSCAHVTLDLASARALGTALADEAGTASFDRFVPAAAAGLTLHFQAIDAGSCKLSDVVITTF